MSKARGSQSLPLLFSYPGGAKKERVGSAMVHPQERRQPGIHVFPDPVAEDLPQALSGRQGQGLCALGYIAQRWAGLWCCDRGRHSTAGPWYS